MTVVRLAQAAIVAALASALVAFVASARAAVDYAAQVGVHPDLALAMPVFLEGIVVVSGATIVACRIHDDLEQSKLALVMFAAAVSVSTAINAAHGGPDPAAAFLSALPPLALPATLHLALDLWLRVRDLPATKKRTHVRRRVEHAFDTAPRAMPRAASQPAAATGDTNGQRARAEGDTGQLLRIAQIRDRYPTAGDLAQLLDEHSGNQAAAANAIPTHRGTLRKRMAELEMAG